MSAIRLTLQAREAVQQSLDYNVTWYLAKPATIIKTLQEVYRLEAAGLALPMSARSKSFGERIADVLIEDGLLLPNQLEEAIDIQKKQGGRLLKILTDKQFVTDQDMAFSMGRCLNTPPINLSKVRVPEEIMTSGPARHGEGPQAGSDRASRYGSCSWRWPTRPTCSRSTT